MTEELRLSHIAFTGYDNGHHSLPPEMIAARDDLRRIEDLLSSVPQPENEFDALDRLAAEVLAGSEVDTDALATVHVQRATHEAALGILRRAREPAGGQLASVVCSHAEETIRQYLVPVHDKTVAEVAKCAKAMGGLPDNDASSLARAGKVARDAYLQLDELAARYSAVRQTRSALYANLGADVEHDHNGYFTAIRNTEKLWPAITQQVAPPRDATPWPKDSTRGFLLWAVRNGAELWLPTVEQQDARWYDVFGARLEEAKRNRRALTGTRGSSVSDQAETFSELIRRRHEEQARGRLARLFPNPEQAEPQTTETDPPEGGDAA